MSDTMKFFRYKILTLAVALMLVGSACNVLDQDPQQSITPDDLFVDGRGAQVALNGLYSSLQVNELYGLNLPLMGDQYVDISTYNGFFNGWEQLDDGVIPASNSDVEETWIHLYETIENANNVINFTPVIVDDAFSDDARANVVAQALTIRSLAYYDLLRHWAEHDNLGSQFGVPVLTESLGGDLSNLTFLPRNSVQELYDRIETDLLAAIPNLSNNGDPGIVTAAFAEGLLARLYLFRGDYTNAADYATRVIDNGNYALEADYASVFQNDNTGESIFELDFNINDQSGLSNFLLVRSEVIVDQNVVDYFYPGPDGIFGDRGPDTRGDMIIFSRNAPRFFKYEDNANGTDPAYIMRLSEMFLIRAEALALGSGDPTQGLPDLNVIHNRAGLGDIVADPGYSMNDFVTDLLNERKYELYAEGHRFPDLVRLGRLADVGITDSFRKVFPIPLFELQIPGNQIQQFPGYAEN